MCWVWFGPKDLKGSTWALQVSQELDTEDYTQISLGSLLFLAKCVVMCLENKFIDLSFLGVHYYWSVVPWTPLGCAGGN